MNSSRSHLSSPLFASSSPNFRSTASIPSSSSPSRTSVPVVHDNTGRASTACQYSPSLVAEEQTHGSKDILSLKGEKALLELLLDMALDNSTSVSSSTSSAKSGASLDLGATSATLMKEVSFLAEESGTSATQLDAPQLHRVAWIHSYEELLSKGQVFIRSKRLLERRSKKRKNAPRASSTDVLCSVANSKKKEKSKKFGRVLDPGEPFKLFLRDPETTEFLTAKQEKHLFSQIQDGCCGLMKTFEKFNPNKGCRFPTYAYWWIRQSIKKSIFKNSRLIRLPESVFALLTKVRKARMECIMEGEQPTNVNVARRAGIAIEKLARLKAKTRKPRSMQDRVWSDEGVTFQEITEDPNVEPPDLSVDRMMMRKQVRDFLGILSPREKEIIEHRFGIYDGEPKTLHVIGDMYGLSKERIRQLQNRALDKLKRSVSAQGFGVYLDLLT